MQIGAPMVRVLERLHQNHRKRQALVAANRALLRNDQLARLEALVEAEKLASTLSLAEGHLSVELNHAANEIYFVDGLTATDGTGQFLAGSVVVLKPTNVLCSVRVRRMSIWRRAPSAVFGISMRCAYKQRGSFCWLRRVPEPCWDKCQGHRRRSIWA
jgi:hypothetical protein